MSECECKYQIERLTKLLAEKDEMPKEMPTRDEMRVSLFNTSKSYRNYSSYRFRHDLEMATWSLVKYAQPIINNLKSQLAASEETVKDKETSLRITRKMLKQLESENAALRSLTSPEAQEVLKAALETHDSKYITPSLQDAIPPYRKKLESSLHKEEGK